ncbi:hypothetical protein Hanom_Chr09g00777641 [Helianthus anomalus]
MFIANGFAQHSDHDKKVAYFTTTLHGALDNQLITNGKTVKDAVKMLSNMVISCKKMQLKCCKKA